MLTWNKRLLKTMDRVLAPRLYSFAGRWNSRPGKRTRSADFVRSGNGCPVPVESVERILIIRPGGLGDAVLTFPMIHALGAYYDQARVDVLAEMRNADIYLIHSRVNRVYSYDRHFPTDLLRLRRTRYDMIVDTEQFHLLSTLLASVLGSTYICGFGSPMRTQLLTHPVPYSTKNYEAVSFLNMAQAVTGHTFAFNSDSPFINIPLTLQRWAEKTLRTMRTPHIVTIAPSTTAEDRIWPSERYIRIIRSLIQNDLSILVLGGKDAVGISDSISEGFHHSDVQNLSGKTSIPESAALIQRARAHLSSDTGILHIAYGLGIPTVSLFGPGIHDKWAPRGHRHVMLRAGLSCSPCTVRGEIPPCPHGAACIKEIGEKSVIDALKKVLAI